MAEKIVLIVDQSLIHGIDKCRGQISRSDFVVDCIKGKVLEQSAASSVDQDFQKSNSTSSTSNYVTRSDFARFKLDVEKMQMEFMSFFVKYGKQLSGERQLEVQPGQFNEDIKKLFQI